MSRVRVYAEISHLLTAGGGELMPSNPKSPQLGSLAIQAPTLTPKTVHVSSATCHDLSLFKGVVFWPSNSVIYVAYYIL